MTTHDALDNASFKVLVNRERQYCIWGTNKTGPPAGWREVRRPHILKLPRIIPRGIVRTVRKVFFKGKQRFCPVCESKLREFLPYGVVKKVRANSYCPVCGTVERHRFSWLYLERRTAFFSGAHRRFLHIAPEGCLKWKFQFVPGIDYLSADLADPCAMVRMDLTDIQYPDASFDAIYCSHVLEHIPDDLKAMRELYRVLAKGGWVLIQVPIREGPTVEDPGVTDPKERERRFGQHDHVREYGLDVVDRLQGAGFHVTMTRNSELVPEKSDRTYLGFESVEPIFFAVKQTWNSLPVCASKPAAARSGSPAKKITVIIPVWNDGASLRLCLDCLEKQTYPKEDFEVIVVDNGSTVEMGPIKTEFADVRWLREDIPGSYAARNLGLRHASGAIIALTDSDCLPTPQWLENAVSALEGSNATILGGRIEFPAPKTGKLNVYEALEEATTLMTDHRRAIEEMGVGFTANIVAYASVFGRVGCFNPELKSSGDFEWIERAKKNGEIIKYVDSAVVRHPRRSSFKAICQRRKRVGGGKIGLAKSRHASPKEILFEIYKFSAFNPGTFRRAWCAARSNLPAGDVVKRLHFIAAYLSMSLSATLEQLRVACGAEPRRR
jgi:glycosyltransferase involved in cell wall biosynthesis/SAM-dependent methyltransferase